MNFIDIEKIETEDSKRNLIKSKVEQISSLKPEALTKIIEGLYAGKPLLGQEGLLTKLIKDLTQIALQG